MKVAKGPSGDGGSERTKQERAENRGGKGQDKAGAAES